MAVCMENPICDLIVRNVKVVVNLQPSQHIIPSILTHSQDYCQDTYVRSSAKAYGLCIGRHPVSVRLYGDSA